MAKKISSKKNKRPLRVFFSYATADGIYASQLHRLLSQRLNLRIFTQKALSAGEDWKSKLKRELAQCDIFVVLLSPNSLQSAWVLQELGAAWMLDKPIISVVTQPEVLDRVPIALRKDLIIEIEDLENPETIDRILEHYEEQVVTLK
jgi:hypothetical protein